MKIPFRYYAGLLLVLLAVASCKKNEKAAVDTTDIKGNYFSIKQFALDEWNTFSGEPFLIVKSVRINNGKPDSSMTNSDTISWAPIFKAFFDADISDRKFIGKYTFTQFDDREDETHNFFYQANDEDLFTQKLLITIDDVSSKVKGIYVETYKKTFMNTTVQKLYYSPMKTIQIQNDEKPMLGSKKFTVTEYTFMR